MGASALDVGGGTSTLADRLLALGYRVGLLDFSREALVRARSGSSKSGRGWVQ